MSADMLLDQAGELTLLGRIDDADVFKEQKARWPSGYILLVDQDGRWELESARFKMPTAKLASGKVPFAMKKWHHLVLRFNGSNTEASIDRVVVTRLNDPVTTMAWPESVRVGTELSSTTLP